MKTNAGLSQDKCYKPIEFLSEEQRERKVKAFKQGYMIVRFTAPRCCLLKQWPSSADLSAVSRPHRLCVEGGADGAFQHTPSLRSSNNQQGYPAGYRHDSI